jgi:hypothetical protein
MQHVGVTAYCLSHDHKIASQIKCYIELTNNPFHQHDINYTLCILLLLFVTLHVSISLDHHRVLSCTIIVLQCHFHDQGAWNNFTCNVYRKWHCSTIIVEDNTWWWSNEIETCSVTKIKSKVIDVALTEKIIIKWNTQQDATEENKKKMLHRNNSEQFFPHHTIWCIPLIQPVSLHHILYLLLICSAFGEEIYSFIFYM